MTESTPQAYDEGSYEVHVHLPDPSIWPLVISLGITILFLGFVLGLPLIIVGLLVFIFGIGGWLYQDVQTIKKGQQSH